ncbi:hypothetical protein KCP75_21080 [Salmonella enterica subsp. enterica]|nr:hypothetical protein KCP75_21080 [Salmonella enterica subsp. enterica]
MRWRPTICLPAKTQITPEDLARNAVDLLPVQFSRLDVWRHFRNRRVSVRLLKSVIIRYC